MTRPLTAVGLAPVSSGHFSRQPAHHSVRLLTLPARRCINCQDTFCGVDEMCLRCTGATPDERLARAALALSDRLNAGMGEGWPE